MSLQGTISICAVFAVLGEKGVFFLVQHAGWGCHGGPLRVCQCTSVHGETHTHTHRAVELFYSIIFLSLLKNSSVPFTEFTAEFESLIRQLKFKQEASKQSELLVPPCAIPAVPCGRRCEGRTGSPGSRGGGRRAAPRCGHTEQAAGTAVRRPWECGAGRGTQGPGAATLKVARLGHSCSPARLGHKSRDPTRAGCAGG